MGEDKFPPIDFVVPMVFPQDPAWQREYARHCSADAARHVRYRSWDTEDLLVRCCMKYMPWLRTIHILLDSESQVQPWMESIQSPSGEKVNVRLCFHRDFIPNRFRPCYSSPCIEMFLNRIPGLAEHFIYANDDMFPLSPLKPDDFFRQEGDGGKDRLFLPCQRISEKPYPVNPNTFHRACMDGLNMVAAPFGKRYTNTCLRNGHSHAPLLLSSCEEVWRRHGRQIQEHISPFKRRPDSYNQYLYVYYQFLAGLFVEHAPRHVYVGAMAETEKLIEVIRDPHAGIVCINDNEKLQDWEKRAATVRAEIAAKIEK